MRSRRILAFWAATVGALFLVEIAEITHLFRVPLLSAVGNLVSFVFALVFTTILALVGALFIGIYISQRLQTGGGFTEFEEEMLRMRSEVQQIAHDVRSLRDRSTGEDPPTAEGPPGKGRA